MDCTEVLKARRALHSSQQEPQVVLFTLNRAAVVHPSDRVSAAFSRAPGSGLLFPHETGWKVLVEQVAAVGVLCVIAEEARQR